MGEEHTGQIGRRIDRPCSAADLVPLTEEHRWRRSPLSFDPTPWEVAGPTCGFTGAFTVRTDNDWNGVRLESDAHDAVRFVLVSLPGGWELRAGQANLAAVEADIGGTHSDMFSASEAELATAAGTPIRAGFLWAIQPDYIEIS